MTKVIVEMDFDMDEFNYAPEEEQIKVIETVLSSGAESTNSYISVKSVEIHNYPYIVKYSKATKEDQK